MNFNIVTYSIYLPIVCFVTIKVGWLFYSNGSIFLLKLFNNKKHEANSTNKLLLTGYYLINIGYAIYTISNWQYLNTSLELINSLAISVSRIILILAILHYNNLFWIQYISKSKF